MEQLLSTLVGIVFPILTIVVGGACVLLFGVTTTLRASNGDLRARVTDLEAGEGRSQEKIAGQASEIAALQRVVTGEVQLTAIADVLGHHHSQSVAVWTGVEHTLTEILVELRKAS
jgi:hypothetical protein